MYFSGQPVLVPTTDGEIVQARILTSMTELLSGRRVLLYVAEEDYGRQYYALPQGQLFPMAVIMVPVITVRDDG